MEISFKELVLWLRVTLPLLILILELRSDIKTGNVFGIILSSIFIVIFGSLFFVLVFCYVMIYYLRQRYGSLLGQVESTVGAGADQQPLVHQGIPPNYRTHFLCQPFHSEADPYPFDETRSSSDHYHRSGPHHPSAHRGRGRADSSSTNTPSSPFELSSTIQNARTMIVPRFYRVESQTLTLERAYSDGNSGNHSPSHSRDNPSRDHGGRAERQASLEDQYGADVCCICLERMRVVGSTLLYLPCSHRFHPDCIGHWLDEHRTCPLCNLDLTTTDEYKKAKAEEEEKEAKDEESGVASANASLDNRALQSV